VLPLTRGIETKTWWKLYGPVVISADDAGGQEEGLLAVYLCMCNNETGVPRQCTEAKFLVPDRAIKATLSQS
jgi:hypothetical protein